VFGSTISTSAPENARPANTTGDSGPQTLLRFAICGATMPPTRANTFINPIALHKSKATTNSASSNLQSARMHFLHKFFHST
jgi:hypothetical protein